MDCKFLNSSTCCSALVAAERPTTIPRSKKRSTCQITKVYHPSPYEINQLAKAEEIAKNTNPEMRLSLFREFIESPQEIEHATRWLRRVAKRQPGTELEKNDVDRYYLSRFKVTEVCPTEPKQTSWWEYIEPLTVHARHPFAFQRCLDSKNPSKRIPVYVNISLPVVSKTSVDYLLLSPDRRRAAQSSKTFLLDAGTSRFDSSLNWFVCAYQQLGYVFNEIFGWEVTLLEPNDFWNHVPQRYLDIYHFFNAPISSDPTAHHSPLRIIRKIATPEDFVSFKLDVDTPAVEIPIAMEILHDPKLLSLLDEFFFELHFRCEIMMSCGWGTEMPEVSHGLKLDRPNVLKFFQKLRFHGIRAHIWP